jgi:hypothetical protein
MVETWRDSWFEEGTRVFYIVPPAAVDRILPLNIQPAPESVVRVFVGRVDVITPTCIRTVQKAFADNDRRTLERYGRRLGSIADRILARTSAPEDRDRMLDLLDRALASYARRAGNCE